MNKSKERWEEREKERQVGNLSLIPPVIKVDGVAADVVMSPGIGSYVPGRGVASNHENGNCRPWRSCCDIHMRLLTWR